MGEKCKLTHQMRRASTTLTDNGTYSSSSSSLLHWNLRPMHVTGPTISSFTMPLNSKSLPPGQHQLRMTVVSPNTLSLQLALSLWQAAERGGLWLALGFLAHLPLPPKHLPW